MISDKDKTTPILLPNKFARSHFTPNQLRGIEEFIQAPEEATVWIVRELNVVQVYKRRVRTQNNETIYEVADTLNGPLAPGVYTRGVNAFETEIEALRSARSHLALVMEHFIDAGKALAARERAILERNVRPLDP